MAEALVLGLLQSTNRPYSVQVGCRGLSLSAVCRRCRHRFACLRALPASLGS